MTARKFSQPSKKSGSSASVQRSAKTGNFVSTDYTRSPATKEKTVRESSKTRAHVGSKSLGHVKLTELLSQEQDGGWLATCPSLPRCVSQGETIAKVKRNIKEAIIGWLIVKNEQATDQAKRSYKGNRQIQEFALSL
jgi:predicted RNase H-like HicB family nuclease